MDTGRPYTRLRNSPSTFMRARHFPRSPGSMEQFWAQRRHFTITGFPSCHSLFSSAAVSWHWRQSVAASAVEVQYRAFGAFRTRSSSRAKWDAGTPGAARANRMVVAQAAGNPARSPIFEVADINSRREIMLPSFDTIIPGCPPCQCLEKRGYNTYFT